jgi:hypothetical protein
LSHVILDMLQFFDMDNEMEPPGEDGIFSERVQYMFHAPSIAAGHKDPYADGGGPALLPNQNRGPHYAERTAQGIGRSAASSLLVSVSASVVARALSGQHVQLQLKSVGAGAAEVPGLGHDPPRCGCRAAPAGRRPPPGPRPRRA